MTRCHLTCPCVAVLAMGLWVSTANAGLITSVTETGTALNANVAQVEAVPFGEDAWVFTNRTHEYNGVPFDATTKKPATAGTLIVGLPKYLVGQQYITTANDNRAVADYKMLITVNAPVNVYVLVDNRRGDNDNTNPPALSATVMPWLLNWSRMSTGISPALPDGTPQLDYVGIDEGGSVANAAARTHLSSVGPGVDIQNFSTIYRKAFANAGTIELGEFNEAGRNMYGVVVAPIPEPAAISLLALSALGLTLRRRA